MKKKAFITILLAALIFTVLIPGEVFALDTMTDAIKELIGDAAEDIDGLFEDSGSDITIQASPDKYTWYMQNYVGKNVASIGYTSLGGDRLDTYGAGHIELNLVADDGMYLDINDENILKQYIVKAQSIEPNTEIKYTFQVDSEGNEYSNLVDFQNIDEIDLLVSKIGQDEPGPIASLEAINPAPDKYTRYIKCYVGKNAASIGYYSLGGQWMDSYGNGSIRIIFVSQDGTDLSGNDTELLSRYIVASQDIEPNSEIKFTYLTDSNGEEYSNLIDYQTYENITLYVAPLANVPAIESVAEDDNSGDTVSAEVVPGVTLANFNKINSSMTYEDVCQLFGKEGELLSDVDIGIPEYATQMYMWYGDGIANCNVLFQGGYMSEKAQVGLK